MPMRIGLVACVGLKREIASPARELYSSPLFLKSRAWVEAHCDCWYVLSAKYGLVAPEELIETYGVALRRMTASQCRDWAVRVYGQLGSAGLLRAAHTFVWLAGAKYRNYLSRLMSDERQENPLEGLRIGEQLHWLDGASDGTC